MRDYKFFRESKDDLSKEKKKFEEEIEMQLLSSEIHSTKKSSYMPYQDVKKKLINSLLISVLLLGIMLFGGWYFAKNQYSTLSTHNVEMIQVAIQYSVDAYYQDHRRYPVDIHGNIDFNLLKNKGYLNLNIEEYKSMFRFDNQYNVTLRQTE